MGKLIVLDPTGHSTLEWDVKDKQSVQQVREEFNRIVSRIGYAAFADGVLTKKFDPAAKEIKVAAQIAGG